MIHFSMLNQWIISSLRITVRKINEEQPWVTCAKSILGSKYKKFLDLKKIYIYKDC